MCMIDASERMEPLTYDVRKAQRDYRCCECGRHIARGEIYENARGMYDGFWHTYRTCMHCVEARKWLMSECGGHVFECLREDLEEHLHEEGYSYTNRKLMALRRLIWAIASQWRT